MADIRRSLGWGLLAAALVAAGLLAWLVLRDSAAPTTPPSGTVLTRTGGTASAPEKPVISVPLEPRRAAPAPERPAPPPTGAATGRIVRPDRRVLVDAHIEALKGSNAGSPGMVALASLGKHADVDSAGRFTLSELPPMEDLMLRIDGDSFAFTEIGPYSVPAGATTDLGDIVVARSLALTGTVLDPRGRPVAGARVGLLQNGTSGRFDGAALATASGGGDASFVEPSRLVLTDVDGRFGIPNARYESFMLQVTAKGYANALVPGGPLPGEDLTYIDVPVALRVAEPVRGRVVTDADETPVAGARVFAEPLDKGNGRSQTVTLADGEFELENLAAGSYVLRATAEGFSAGGANVTPTRPTEPIVIRLPRQGSLSGHVVGTDGQPIRNFDLQPRFRGRRLDPALPRGSFQRVSGSDGSFTIRNLDPGFWSVDVWASGYSLTSCEAVKVKQAQDAQGLVVTMLRGASLSGAVLDADNRPVAGVEVSLHPNREPEIAFLRSAELEPGVSKVTHTDAEGRFILKDLSAHAYQVQVDHPGFAVVLRDDVVVPPEADVTTEPFVLQRAATVKGAALSSGRDALPGVTVTLQAVNGLSHQVTSDGKGQFVFTRVREGDYQLLCYGRELSLATMLASIQNPPETFHVAPGDSVVRNAVSYE